MKSIKKSSYEMFGKGKQWLTVSMNWPLSLLSLDSKNLVFLSGIIIKKRSLSIRKGIDTECFLEIYVCILKICEHQRQQAFAGLIPF